MHYTSSMISFIHLHVFDRLYLRYFRRHLSSAIVLNGLSAKNNIYDRLLSEVFKQNVTFFNEIYISVSLFGGDL